jgi:hypothetical protein
MAKNFENLILGGLHEKHAVQRGIWLFIARTIQNTQIQSVPHRKQITYPLQSPTS